MTAEPAAQSVESLASETRRLLASFAEAAPFLEGWLPLIANRAVHPQALPVCRWLADLDKCAAPETLALVHLVVAASPTLDWRQTYSATDFGAHFLQSYGWTELIGLRGPIASARIACGFLMLGPQTDYPAHAHEAEELYLPLAGSALWRRGEEGAAVRPPGLPIRHRSWEPHAMRTQEEPMLAIYVWRGGDLAAKSKIVRQT